MRGEKVEHFCKKCRTLGAAVRYRDPTGIVTHKCLRCGEVTVIRPQIPVSLQKPSQKTKKELRQTTLLFFLLSTK